MTDNVIKPEKITKPIQLLGAWLAGLFMLDSSFLTAASYIGAGTWESRALVVSAICNVPLFLLAVFVLQTRFRPELQEDSYYSTYLSQKTDKPIDLKNRDLVGKASSFEEQELDKLEIRESKGGDTFSEGLGKLTFGINKFAANREEIKAELGSAGVLVCTSFGGDDPPARKVVSVSRRIPADVLREVLKLTKKLGYEHYKFFDNVLEDAEEDVLIGSYGDPQYEII